MYRYIFYVCIFIPMSVSRLCQDSSVSNQAKVTWLPSSGFDYAFITCFLYCLLVIFWLRLTLDHENRNMHIFFYYLLVLQNRENFITFWYTCELVIFFFFFHYFCNYYWISLELCGNFYFKHKVMLIFNFITFSSNFYILCSLVFVYTT